MITFTPKQDFFSPKTRSEYVAGLTYSVPDDEDHAELAALLPIWVTEGKVALGAAAARAIDAKVGGAGEVGFARLPVLFALVVLFAALLGVDPSFLGFSLAVTHPTATRNAIADLVVDSLDTAGSPSLPAKLVFLTAGDVTVATLTFTDPAFGNAAAGVATANAIASDTNAVGGTIAKAELRNNAGTARVLCSVTATGGGGDIQLNSVIVSAGQTVAMTSLTYTAPA